MNIEQKLNQRASLFEEQQKKSNAPILTVGFNRRFSPHIIKIKDSIGESQSPINIIANMNAVFISSTHWVHDLESGGGRIIGEACHLIDISVYLTGSLVKPVCKQAV